MQVDKIHGFNLIYDPVQEPVGSLAGQLIYAADAAAGGNTENKPYRLAAPPRGRFTPAAQHVHNPIKPPAPDKGRWTVRLSDMHCDGFIN